jgi:hypothetical protein
MTPFVGFVARMGGFPGFFGVLLPLKPPTVCSPIDSGSGLAKGCWVGRYDVRIGFGINRTSA